MKRRGRGFTIAEVLTVLVIVGLILSAVAMTTPMILRGQSQVQAQVDNIESSALALYRVQRDLRQSDTGGIFDCTATPVVVCSQPNTSPVATPALVIATADNGTGEFQPDAATAGSPKWQGFYVYWLTPNADGTSNDLKRAYFPWPGPGQMVLSVANHPTVQAAAVTALSTLLGSGNPETVAQDVIDIKASIDTTNSIVSLRLDSGNTSGTVSSMTLWGDSYVRN
jgi:prepilin-type N-terminal cleavage/methylation domain-containing protein